jgi:putative phosphoribosyl transferase
VTSITAPDCAGTDDRGGEHLVCIPPIGLDGTLALPTGRGGGVILFAHGSGSSRLSPRNSSVATALRQAGFATLLFDLLSEGEAADRGNVFDIALLAERLLLATAWLRNVGLVRGLPIGYFGASTGAAAALVAAARPDNEIGAVVSRGGRPDLAGSALPHVRAPTLLIVGGADADVLALNRSALHKLSCEAKLELIAGATHLFEEPGALEEVVRLAQRWFLDHLVTVPRE